MAMGFLLLEVDVGDAMGVDIPSSAGVAIGIKPVMTETLTVPSGVDVGFRKGVEVGVLLLPTTF